MLWKASSQFSKGSIPKVLNLGVQVEIDGGAVLGFSFSTPLMGVVVTARV